MKIAIVGKICSGKTTLSNSIVKEFGKYNIIFSKKSFADNVYKIAYDIFDMKEKNRYLLQSIGTKMREIDPDVFVNSTIKNIEDNVIIDDCRFLNEIQNLKKSGFTLIKLNISNELQLIRLQKTYANSWHTHDLSHVSENEIDLFDNDIFDIIIDVDNYNSVENIINYIFPILNSTQQPVL